MAGFVSVANNNVYHSFVSTEADGVENGLFVTPDYKTGEAKLSSAGDEDVYFVSNENTDISEYGIDDVDFKTKEGDFLRAKKPSVGEVFVTTKFAEGLVQGDGVAIGAKGEVVKVAAETDGKFVVKAETTAFGEAALSLLVVG